jgi:hypothetical protein
MILLDRRPFLARNGKNSGKGHSPRRQLPSPKEITLMKAVLALSSALIAVGVCGSTLVLAQSAPPDAVMLVPGVYTTPEISAKCQAYAAKRVVGGSNTDTSRQAVALACAQKLWKAQLAKGAK